MSELKTGAFTTMILLSLACSKTDAPKANAVALATGSVQDAQSTPGDAGSDAGAASGAAAAYAADFEAEESQLTLPEDVKWKGDTPPTEGVGKGTLAMTVDSSGRVKGSGAGPFGDVVLAGLLRDGVISGSILRRSPDDPGFSGVFLAMESGGAWKGSLAVSKSNGGALRRATFTLVKK